jgi:hypothetical protein
MEDKMKDAENFEKQYVEKVYNVIAPHFSQTRTRVKKYNLKTHFSSLGLLLRNFYKNYQIMLLLQVDF